MIFRPRSLTTNSSGARVSTNVFFDSFYCISLSPPQRPISHPALNPVCFSSSPCLFPEMTRNTRVPSPTLGSHPNHQKIISLQMFRHSRRHSFNMWEVIQPQSSVLSCTTVHLLCNSQRWSQGKTRIPWKHRHTGPGLVLMINHFIYGIYIISIREYFQDPMPDIGSRSKPEPSRTKSWPCQV